MAIEDAIKEIERTVECCKMYLPEDDPWILALNIAISALRAQQIPAKLDRSLWEGCDYCKGDLEGYTAQFRDMNGRSRPLYIPEGEAMIVAPGKYNHRFCIPIKYCPGCGKPLTEEVWAELERKINGRELD